MPCNERICLHNLDIIHVLKPQPVAHPGTLEIHATDCDRAPNRNLPHITPVRVTERRCHHLDCVLNCNRHRIPDKEVTVRYGVNDLSVDRVEIVKTEADIGLADSEIDHELPDRISSDAALSERPERRHSRVVPSGVLPATDRIRDCARAEPPELMELHPAPVQGQWVLPA